MGELGENPGRPARKMTTYTECYTNDDAPERGITKNYDFLWNKPSTDGLGQAAARWRIPFVWLARLLLHICFAAFVDAYFLSIPAIAYGLQAV